MLYKTLLCVACVRAVPTLLSRKSRKNNVTVYLLYYYNSRRKINNISDKDINLGASAKFITTTLMPEFKSPEF